MVTRAISWTRSRRCRRPAPVAVCKQDGCACRSAFQSLPFRDARWPARRIVRSRRGFRRAPWCRWRRARRLARPTTPWRAIARPSGLRSSARARVPAASSCGMACVATGPRRGASARGRSAGATRRSTSARRPTRPARRLRGSIRISTAAPHAEVRLVRRTVAVTTSATSETHRTSAAGETATSATPKSAPRSRASVDPSERRLSARAKAARLRPVGWCALLRALGGMRCQGPECGRYATLDECEEAHATCTPPEGIDPNLYSSANCQGTARTPDGRCYDERSFRDAPDFCCERLCGE